MSKTDNVQKGKIMISITDLLMDCGDSRIENAVKQDRLISELKRLSKKRQDVGELPNCMNNLLELKRIDDLIVEKVLKFFADERKMPEVGA